MIAVIAGGVGAARFLRGLVEVVDPNEITAVVNVADDFRLHGLRICPDIDTVRSTLADDIGPLGWGRAGESWTAMAELKALGAQAPPGSLATDWFSLGDRDLAVHLYRTQRLSEGASLARVTAELSRAARVAVNLLPVTETPVSTKVTLEGGDEIDFQEYFVGLRHSVPIRSVRFDRIEEAKPGDGVLDALTRADTVVIAPSNPFVSIAPVLGVEGVAEALRARREFVVAVSPIIGGKAVKGPADRMFSELGGEPGVAGVASLWSEYASRLVIDTVDWGDAGLVEGTGMQAVVTETLMTDTMAAAALARVVIGS